MFRDDAEMFNPFVKLQKYPKLNFVAMVLPGDLRHWNSFLKISKSISGLKHGKAKAISELVRL